MVRAIDWLNHLDFESKNPYRRHWFSQIMGHNTLLRYDQRGSGLEAVVPASEGRLIASRIRGARYVELPSRSAEVVPGEPAWEIFVDEFSRFLGWTDGHVALQPSAAAT